MDLRTSIAALALVGATAGCPSAPSDDDDDATLPEPRAPRWGTETIGGDRPARVVAPEHDGVTDLPVVLLLHGYGANAELQDFYLQISARVEEDGFLLVLPDGTRDSGGSTFWNAFPESGEAVDDVGYLLGLVDELSEVFYVDEERVGLMGHSNGGFMSYRLACEHAERFAGLVSLAGLSPYPDEADCEPFEPVSVLQVHGTDDSQVPYEGWGDGRLAADALAARWAERAGCGPPVAGDPLDLIDGIEGAETEVRDWREGCGDGAQVSLWTMFEGGHLPYFNAAFRERALAFLLAQRR